MSHPHEPGTDALDEGELLAAYLDADTDEVTTARVERRLQTDREFAARLDAVAATRARLQRLDQVAAPAAARAGLDARLAAERAGEPAPTREASPARERRWRTINLAPLAAAAVLVVVAVIGVGSLVTGGGGEGAGAAESSAVTQAAGNARSEPAVAGDSGPAAANEEAGAAGGAGGMETGEPANRRDLSAPAPRAGDDAEIRARALELLDEPVEDLAARERRLRRAAGLPVDRLCVDGLDASTVDVVDADGRVVVAVLLPGGELMQVVLLDPKSCVPIRTIPASR